MRHAQEAMRAAQHRMELHDNRKRTPLTFNARYQVSLKTKHLGIIAPPSQKLFPSWLGPLDCNMINPTVYQLELPHKWKAEVVCHISLLR